MTDNEIKKALEKILELMCNEGDLQRSAIISKSLDLINRQEAEIKRLKNTLDDVLDREPVLVERSEKYAKAEAVKEFAEQVKMAFYYEFEELIPSIMADKIDNILKEMVGEQREEDESNA